MSHLESDALNYVFDEHQLVGVDFTNAHQAATFDIKQGTSAERDRALLKSLGLSNDHSLLDLGCGTGSLVCEAARYCQKVYAVDVSKAMLEIARQRCEQHGLENVEFHQAGFLTYRHGGEPVDFVTTKSALHQLPDFWKGVALHHIYQWLKPGGILYIWDVVYSFAPSNYQTELEAWIHAAGREDGISFTKADFAMHVREEFSTYTWVLELLLQRAGFQIVKQNSPSPTRAEYVCIKP